MTGESDEEWWFARSALLGEVAPDFTDRYPSLSAMESESTPQQPPSAPGEEAMPYLEREARETFAVGLDVLLDGIEAAIRRTGAA